MLSPSTRRHDLDTKLPLYASYGVPHCWIVDPDAGSVDVYVLTGGRLERSAAFRPGETIRADPFAALEFVMLEATD